MHSEKNAMEGAKGPRCSGDEAMGKVLCLDCLAGGDDEHEGDGRAKAQRAKRGMNTQKRSRAGRK